MKSEMLMALLLSLGHFLTRCFCGGFNVSRSLGVKSGVITAPSGADAVLRATAAAEPAVKTLSDTMRDALAAADANKIAIVNIATREVTIVPEGTDITQLTNAMGVALLATIEPDDVTKASGPMTGVDESATAEGATVAGLANTASKPSLSVGSLVNRIEDLVIDPAAIFVENGSSAFVVIDQAAANVKVYGGDLDVVEGIDGAVLAEDAKFVQTLQPPSGRQFGE